MNARSRKLGQICRKYPLNALYVFGSHAAETLRALDDEPYSLQPLLSDLDVGALTHAPFSVEAKVNLAVELEQVFKVPRVDLVVLQEADAFLAANIIRGERIYVKDTYLADEYELFVLGRAGDLADLERERMEMILHAR